MPNQNSIQTKNIFQKQTNHKDIFTFVKPEKTNYQQTSTTRNVKGSPSRKKVIPDGNLDLHKEMKSNVSYNSMGKYKH